MNQSMSLNFFSDPGHAWLEVSKSLLKQLDVEQQISSFSYVNHSSDMVYLEEDSDAGIFMDAAKQAGIEISFDEIHQENTPIRSYLPYHSV